MHFEQTLKNTPGFPKSLIVVYSCHHHNTEKIAQAMARVLGAPVQTPQETNPEDVQDYDLTGFGSGIYGGRHGRSVLDLTDRLPYANKKKAFLFSTCGVPASIAGKKLIEDYREKSHFMLREKLQAKGYVIIGEFNCPGFNTNSFLKYFGGLNKGRPDKEDLTHAEEFARNLIQIAWQQ